MKSALIIIASLIHLSAFSQDLIEYRDFKFYQDGLEISFEEVFELTKEYRVANVNFRQGKRDYAVSESTSRSIRRNLTNGAFAFSGGYGALMGHHIAVLQLANDN